MPRHFAIEDTLAAEGTFKVPFGPFRPRIERGDHLITFRRLEDDIEFVATCRALSISDAVLRDEEQEPRRIRAIEISEIEELEKPRSLVVHAGSLEKVYRFLDPTRHFRSKIVNLSEADFKNLVAGRIFMARSVFRYLFTALPLAVQSDFVRQYAEEFPLSTQGTVNSYNTLAPMLVKFISERLTDPLSILSRIAALHEELSEANVPVPPIQTLQLVNEDQRGTVGRTRIRLGQTCSVAASVLMTNRFFAEADGEQPLFREAMSQLRDALEEEERRWDDPIF